MKFRFLLLAFMLAAISPVPVEAGTWPEEAEDENGVIDRRGLFELDRRLQGDLDSLYTKIDVMLLQDIREALADSLDSLEVAAVVQMRDMFLEARRAWTAYCAASSRAVFFKYFGGSIAGAAERQFRINLIKVQMQELREIYLEE